MPGAGRRTGRGGALLLTALVLVSCTPSPATKDATAPATASPGSAATNAAPGSSTPDSLATSVPATVAGAAVPGKAVDIGATTVALSPSGTVRLETVSTRASMMTGGDVLVRVVAGDGVVEPNPLPDPGSGHVSSTELADALLLTVEGGASHVAIDGKAGGGLITGVSEHATVKAWRRAHDDDVAVLQLVNHPVSGPVFAGPRSGPFACNTVAFGLGPARDEACDAPASVRWHYIDVRNQVHDLAVPMAAVPTDAEHLPAMAGEPFIVREERGVINRSNYEIYTLDPTPSGHDQPAGLLGNKRLVYRFGGGCGSQHGQGQSKTNAFDVELLRRGYAVVTSSLNTFQTLCDAVVSAETTMMVKEHFIEAYGVPDLTIGDGGSGGAIQQLLIAQNFPGLLDGITPSLPFPDVVSLLPSVTDCTLLQHYWSTPAGAALTDAQRAAIEGFQSTQTCTNWNEAFGGIIDPRDGCDPSLASKVYDPKLRPAGVRCTFQDSNVNLYGRDPATGFARRPLDNVGVAYGLEALRAGAISVDQFLDLNEHIGGFDADGAIVPTRTHGDVDAIRTAYASGQVVEGGGLLTTPIILRNLDTDALGDIHDRFRSFSLLDRLRAWPGFVPGTVSLWSFATTKTDLQAALATPEIVDDAPVFAMDAWLTAIAQTFPAGATAEELASVRPTSAGDRCVVGGVTFTGAGIYDAGPCHDALPLHGDTRTAAGAPRRNDVLQCTRRPADAATVGVPLTDAQAERVRAVFAEGMCDWTQAGAGHVAITTTWPTLG